MAGSMARYDILGWREILEGEKNSYRIYFDEVFERFENNTFYFILRMIGKPEVKLHDQSSPYCYHI